MTPAARTLDVLWRFIPVAVAALGLYVAISVQLATLNLRVDTIEGNHLVHVQAGLDRIEAKLGTMDVTMTDVRLKVSRLEEMHEK